MRLNQYIDAFIHEKPELIDRNNQSLEVGKIYKAIIVEKNKSFFILKLNDTLFKTNPFESNQDIIFLKLLDYSGKFRFQLIKDDFIIFEEKKENFDNLLSFIRNNLQTEIYNKLIENKVEISKPDKRYEKNQKNDIKELGNIFAKSSIISGDNLYFLVQFDKDKYFHCQIENQHDETFLFVLNISLDGAKSLSIKGYYRKKNKTANINFVTNSKEFYDKIEDSNKVLSEILEDIIWKCTRKFNL
ncbi:MAG TPA: hypothetical protein PK520_01435 [Exilispira sp.]|jgi:hypothetical protein|nr:hypothetical protein [Exilispira sp.]HQM89039.1 hypothetical protein [Exilispira sp.]HQQ18729.1 hypothetical protein [Exilispira sp.]